VVKVRQKAEQLRSDISRFLREKPYHLLEGLLYRVSSQIHLRQTGDVLWTMLQYCVFYTIKREKQCCIQTPWICVLS